MLPTRSLLSVLLVVMAGQVLPAAGIDLSDHGPMTFVNGTYDLTQPPRPYVVTLILDQEGNRFPGFYAGGTDAPVKVTFDGARDHLTQEIRLGHKGVIEMVITNVPAKRGLFDRLPGGQWVEALRRPRDWDRKKPWRPWVITLQRFSDLELQPLRPIKGSDTQTVPNGAQLIPIRVTFHGQMLAPGMKAPLAITGKANLNFIDKVSVFSLDGGFVFKPGDVGLPADQGLITASFWMRSSPSVARPDSGAGKVDEILPVGERLGLD